MQRVRPGSLWSRISNQQQSLAGQMLDTARLVALLPFSTACECVQSIYYFLVVSRPKGQISLDIYVGYSFVSSYVNVQIGCWLVSFGHSLGFWVSQQRSTLRRNKSLILPSHSPFMSSTRYKQRSRTDNTRHHRLLPPSAGQNSSGRTHSSIVPRNELYQGEHTR